MSSQKALRPAERREVVTYLVTGHDLTVQRACQAVGLGRATYYRPLVDWVRRDAPVIAALTTLVVAKSRWGFWKCCDEVLKPCEILTVVGSILTVGIHQYIHIKKNHAVVP